MARIIGAFVALVLLFAILALSVYQMWGPAGLFGILLTGILCLVLLRFLAGRMLRKAFEAPFAAKGAVLRDAGVVVHSVTPTTAPPENPDEPEDEDEERSPAPDLPCAWYLVELTISPGPTIGPFQLWEPGELILTGPEARSSRNMGDLEDHQFELREIWIQDGVGWSEDDGSKYAGEQRLRLLIGAPTTTRQARLRYYFEVFGTIDLPALA